MRITESRSGSKRTIRRMMIPFLLASTLLATFGVTSALATTPCSVWSLSPTTDGVTAFGVGKMDCPTSPKSQWFSSGLIEKFLLVETMQNSKTITITTSAVITLNTAFNCNGHGTDDWVVKSWGKDASGGLSGFIYGAVNSLTC